MCTHKLKICTYNACTLNQSHSFGELNHAATKYNLSTIAIQEHRLFHEETLKFWELSKDYTMITSSATKNQRNASIGGVGFVCKNKYLNSITKTEKISSRILRIDLKGNPATTILSCYAPTNMANDIVAAEFFDKLSDAIEDIPLHNILLVCGDFNAKIGPESTLFTYNKRTNRNGTLLLDLMDSHQLYAANLTFQKPQCRLWTFRYPNGNKGQMDYIIARRKWSKSISNVNAFTNIFSSFKLSIC